jgi:hypothetical protein
MDIEWTHGMFSALVQGPYLVATAAMSGCSNHHLFLSLQILEIR